MKTARTLRSWPLSWALTVIGISCTPMIGYLWAISVPIPRITTEIPAIWSVGLVVLYMLAMQAVVGMFWVLLSLIDRLVDAYLSIAAGKTAEKCSDDCEDCLRGE